MSNAISQVPSIGISTAGVLRDLGLPGPRESERKLMRHAAKKEWDRNV